MEKGREQVMNMKVCTVEEMRTLDNDAQERYGIASEILMENAGEATYSVISEELGVKGKRFLVFCGPGNKGGDGLVVARKIHSQGGQIKVFLLEADDKFKGATKKNFDIATKIGIPIGSVGNIENVREEMEKSDGIIDAIFGTGLSRDIEGTYRKIIELVNKSKKTVFSIDIPSGINGNSGKVMAVAVKADHTVTFGVPKLGNVLYPGYGYCGKLHVSHISFPPAMYEHLKIEINTPMLIPERRKDGHKKDFGDVLFVAGAAGYFGAPYFSAMSFLKTGGGYSRLATPRSIMPHIASRGCEIVYIPLDETETGSLSLKNKDRILKLAGEADMAVIGPGLSLNQETQELVRELTKEMDRPVLLDGDGLTAMSDALDILENRKMETILTPHLGEMARMVKKPVSEVDENKIEILRNTTKKLNATIVLKGANSLIGYSDGRIYINMSGNCGMATAGSGDVLTGTIAAMVGLGLDVKNAVRTGVFVHGFAGDLAVLEKGMDGIVAQDIMEHLPHATKYYREKFDEVRNRYSLHVV